MGLKGKYFFMGLKHRHFHQNIHRIHAIQCLKFTLFSIFIINITHKRQNHWPLSGFNEKTFKPKNGS